MVSAPSDFVVYCYRLCGVYFRNVSVKVGGPLSQDGTEPYHRRSPIVAGGCSIASHPYSCDRGRFSAGSGEGHAGSHPGDPVACSVATEIAKLFVPSFLSDSRKGYASPPALRDVLILAVSAPGVP